MAIIYSYSLNTDLLASDMLVGTATKLYAGKPKNETKNFSLGELAYFISTSGYNTLDAVLHNGNTSLLGANVGEVGIWDPTALSYAKVKVLTSTFQFYSANYPLSPMVSFDFDSIVFNNMNFTSTISTGTPTANRLYTLPNASGTIALTSDIPVITTPTLDEVLLSGNIVYSDISIVYPDNGIFSTSYENGSAVFTNTGSGNYVIFGWSGIRYQTSTPSEFTEVGFIAPSSNNIIQFPDASGTIALTSDLTGYVTSVSATSPITSTGGTTPVISTSMSTNKLIGRSTAGTGVMEEITIGTGLTLSGGILNGSSSGVTSVGLTMPSAFTVTNSPITSSGTIAVTGAGTVSQYVRGDGTLANFPNSTGGGASVNYYLNGSVSQGTFGGVTYYQMSKTPILGAGTNFTRTNGAGNGYIASFITDAGDPSFLNIPGGNWNLELYFQSSASGGSPQFYGEIYKVSATNVFTLIASGSANPEGITNGTTVDQYFTSIPMPQTSLLITDRLAIRIYVITGGRTITLHTENGNLCEVLTTFTTGLTALNGLTQQVQYFAVGTGATNFNISSSGDTHTFNLLSNIRRNANNSSNNNINYNGYAVTGSAESSAVWTITRLTIASSGSVTIGTATNVAWTNRESVIYT